MTDDEQMAERFYGSPEEARQQLPEQYGDRGDAILARVNAFVRARPAVADRLAFTAIGNNPDLVLSLAEIVNTLRTRIAPIVRTRPYSTRIHGPIRSASV